VFSAGPGRSGEPPAEFTLRNGERRRHLEIHASSAASDVAPNTGRTAEETVPAARPARRSTTSRTHSQHCLNLNQDIQMVVSRDRMPNLLRDEGW